MDLSKVGNAAKVCFESKSATLCLAGVAGSGKTSIWSQIYKDLGFEEYVILRPALLADSADLIGLPEFEVVKKGGKATKTTAFMRPKWLPFDGDKCLIIVDEINRATKDVSNALFGLIESEKPFIGDYQLPEGCRVVATCNPPTDNYAGVLDFADSAWSSRLCFVKIAPNLDVYTKYGRNSGTVSNVMLDFLNKNPKFFGTSGDFEVDMFLTNEDGTTETNTRSFTKCSNIYSTAKTLGVEKEVVYELIRGIVGKEFATSFMNFADNYNTVVTVDDLLNDSNAHDRFDYTAMSNVAKVVDDFTFKMDKNEVKAEQLDNILPFFEKIPLDTLKAFLENLVKSIKGDEEVKLILCDKIYENETLNSKLDLFKTVSDDNDVDQEKENTDANN